MEVAAEKYQTFGPRIWAGLVDGFVFIPFVALDHYFSSPGRSRPVLIAWAIIEYSAPWVYSVWLHARYGQTLGKHMARIKVLDVSETSLPRVRQAFLREIGNIIPNVGLLVYFIYVVSMRPYFRGAAQLSGLPDKIIAWSTWAWFLLEIITMFTNSKRRAFHDLIAGTVVVNVPRETAPRHEPVHSPTS